MRNGDSLLVAEVAGPLRLRVGERTIDVDLKRLERLELAEDGQRATVGFTGGDSLAGQLVAARLDLVLAAGPRLSVHPSSLRSLVRTGGS
jgi:hypothetical protein